jgi:Type IV secretion-system coupling protein DNA-binding domain
MLDAGVDRLAPCGKRGGVMLHPETVVADLALTMLLGLTGAVGAWLLRRRTTLSARNLYPLAAAGALMLAGAIGLSAWNATLVLLPLASPWVAGAIVGARWRSSDLGAGEELRNHELGRRWIWQPAPEDRGGERLYLRSQGELVRERPWPRSLDYVSMTATGEQGPRLPLGAGQHVVLFGATGAGKTTTARRLIAARTLHDHSALLVLDQKGDPEDVEHMKQLAAEAGVPFILFDSQDPATDRWQPLWGSPDGVAARVVEAIKQSEPYYYDVLRRHLDVVCKLLHAAGMWPPSIPLLIDACLPGNYEQLVKLAQPLDDSHAVLKRRASAHGTYVSSARGVQDLFGGCSASRSRWR